MNHLLIYLKKQQNVIITTNDVYVKNKKYYSNIMDTNDFILNEHLISSQQSVIILGWLPKLFHTSTCCIH